MLIVYIDQDIEMQQHIADSLKSTHDVVTFAELFEAYKWIRRNKIPEVIITEIDVESSTGLQELKFLLTKAKLKNTRIIGYAHQGVETYADLAVSEGAHALYPKSELAKNLTALFGIKRKSKTLRDVEQVRGKKISADSKSKKHLTKH
jgi:DNA-binding NtrC family response regulator